MKDYKKKRKKERKKERRKKSVVWRYIFLKKLKGGQWTMPGIWNWAFFRNISNFINCTISFCCELRLWGVYNRLIYISLQLSEAESKFLILQDVPPGVFIPAGDASSMKELHLAMILEYPDFQCWLNVLALTVKKLKFMFLLLENIF